MQSHNATVIPIKGGKEFDRHLQVWVRRIYGYRWECSCGEKGPREKTYSDAGHGAMNHKYSSGAITLAEMA